MRTFDCGDNAFCFGKIVEGVNCLLIGSRYVVSTADVVQISKLGGDAGVMTNGGDGIKRSKLDVLILRGVANDAMQ